MASRVDLLMLPLRAASAVAGAVRAVQALPQIARSLDGMTADVQAMRADLAVTRVSVEPMDEDLHAVETAFAVLPEKLDAMRAELTRELELLREDLSGLPFVGKS